LQIIFVCNFSFILMEVALINLLIARCFKDFCFVFEFKITIYLLLWLDNTVNICTLTVVNIHAFNETCLPFAF
jgi:hypothetical protein